MFIEYTVSDLDIRQTCFNVIFRFLGSLLFQSFLPATNTAKNYWKSNFAVLIKSSAEIKHCWKKAKREETLIWKLELCSAN